MPFLMAFVLLAGWWVQEEEREATESLTAEKKGDDKMDRWNERRKRLSLPPEFRGKSGGEKPGLKRTLTDVTADFSVAAKLKVEAEIADHLPFASKLALRRMHTLVRLALKALPVVEYMVSHIFTTVSVPLFVWMLFLQLGGWSLIPKVDRTLAWKALLTLMLLPLMMGHVVRGIRLRLHFHKTHFVHSHSAQKSAGPAGTDAKKLMDQLKGVSHNQGQEDFVASLPACVTDEALGAHIFQLQRFQKPTWCYSCGLFFWAWQNGYSCETCKAVVCNSCRGLGIEDCPRRQTPLCGFCSG